MQDGKIPYIRSFYTSTWTPVELTGKVKTVTGVVEYDVVKYQIYVKLFGFKIGTKWVDRDYIEYGTERKTVITNEKCKNCGGGCGQC